MIADLFRPLIPTGFDRLRARGSRIVEWLGSGDVEFHSAVLDPAVFSAGNYSRKGLESFANEFDIMSCAALESIASCGPDPLSKKAMAWMAIRIYYSAYYAAHAILRLCGRACIHLETGTVNMLGDLARLADQQSLTPLRGSSLVVYDAKQSTLSFRHNTADGGAHVFLWTSFAELLQTVLDGPEAKLPVYQAELLSLLNLLSSIKSRATKGTWMSLVRNEITYKLAHGVWYPFSVDSSTADKLKRKRMIPLAPEQKGLGQQFTSDLDQLFETAAFINAILFQILLDLKERLPRRGCFLHQGIFRLIGIEQVESLFA